MVTVLCVGPDKSRQVRKRVKYYFSSTMSPTLFKFGPPPKPACKFPNRTSLGSLRPSQVVDSWLRHASVGRKVWTGMMCNFISPHHHVRKIAGNLSIRRVWKLNFTRIGHKKRKLMDFDSSGTKAVWAAWLRTTTKRFELELFLAGVRQAVQRYKAIHLRRLIMQLKQDCPKDKKITPLSIFWWKTKKFARLSIMVRL